MPPKVKYTREQIIDAAMALVREKGMAYLTARELGAALGVTAKPIFTAFENMDEVKNEVRKRARELYRENQRDFTEYKPAFKRHGMQTIHFAQNEPRLFQLLFMSGDGHNLPFREAVAEVMGGVDDVLEVIRRDYSLEREEAKKLFDLLWIQVYGISALSAQGVCRFTEEEISDMLSTTFLGVLGVVKSAALSAYVQRADVKKIV